MPPSPEHSSRAWMFFPALMLAMGAGFTVAHFASSAPRAQAEGFLADLRRGRANDALARGTDALRADFARGVTHHDNPTPNDTPAVVTSTLQQSTGVDLGSPSLGVGRRCFEGSLDGVEAPNHVYVEVIEAQGQWRIDGVSVRRAFGLCED